jgi:hypothetical protein
MTIIEVENIVGKPYRTSEFMGTQRADYLIHSPWTKDLFLSGFCVVYEGGKVEHVDKSWSKLQN